MSFFRSALSMPALLRISSPPPPATGPAKLLRQLPPLTFSFTQVSTAWPCTIALTWSRSISTFSLLAPGQRRPFSRPAAHSAAAVNRSSPPLPKKVRKFCPLFGADCNLYQGGACAPRSGPRPDISNNSPRTRPTTHHSPLTTHHSPLTTQTLLNHS